MPSSDRLITTPPPPPGIYCATCDHHSPRWADSPQCYGCLRDKVLPSEYAIKYLVGFDAVSATTALRWWRGEWEEKHPGFQLIGDRERLFPEESAPSKHADRQTSLGRKMFYARWLVVRAHPKHLAIWTCADEARKQQAIIRQMLRMGVGLLPSDKMAGMLVGIHAEEDD